MEIESSMPTSDFDIHYVDSLTRKTYIGSFTAKCYLTPIDFIKADSIYRQLLGPVSPHLASNIVSSFASAISQLQVRLTKSPDWFSQSNEEFSEVYGGHLPIELLAEIVNKTNEVQENYAKKVKQDFEKVQKKLFKNLSKGKYKPEEEEEKSEEAE